MCGILSSLHHVPLAVWPAACASCFVIMLGSFRWSNRGMSHFYFDPQDFKHFENGGGRKLPLAASTGTFAPLLSSYLDVTKLLITVAAASIAFGGGQSPQSRRSSWRFRSSMA